MSTKSYAFEETIEYIDENNLQTEIYGRPREGEEEDPITLFLIGISGGLTISVIISQLLIWLLGHQL